MLNSQEQKSMRKTLVMIDRKRKISWDHEKAQDRQNWLPQFR